tara:strand:- start:37 stop:159 length:123 start_codon:yes stop_codon:yes gene_type:complete
MRLQQGKEENENSIILFMNLQGSISIKTDILEKVALSTFF